MPTKTDQQTGLLKGQIEDYLTGKGIPLNKPFRCLNPEHEDKHPSMHYNAKQHYVHCFSCGCTYDLFDLIGLDYHTDSFHRQFQIASELYRLQAGSQKNTSPARLAEGDPTAGATLPTQRDPDSDSYFLSRGLSQDVIRQNHLFCYHNRAYFPIYEKGSCTSFCSRALSPEDTPRYKNSPGPMGIFHSDYITQAPHPKEIFICEGIVDALSLEELGHPAIALCGVGNQNKFLSLCKQHLGGLQAAHFITAGDNDPAGDKLNRSLTQELRQMHLAVSNLPIPEPYKDINDWLLASREGLGQTLGSVVRPDGQQPLESCSAAACLDQFVQQLYARSHSLAISTGFVQLDRLLDGGLYSGLYILGAVSSIGKTSFLLQIADAIAQQGTDVLFFSLEMGRMELLSKSLSRISYLLDTTAGKTLAFTSRQLLSSLTCGLLEGVSGRKELFEQAVSLYRGGGGRHILIQEGDTDACVGQLREQIAACRRSGSGRLVVMLDYLQILQPADPRATDKQNIDRAVTGLKRISREFDLPVVAVSSFNRENYRNPVTMEAFKESGAVEYSSDVLFGLQLAGTGRPNFDIEQAKARVPRELELVLLKNRNGVPSGRIRYDYLAAYNYFRETGGLPSGKVNRIGQKS